MVIKNGVKTAGGFLVPVKHRQKGDCKISAPKNKTYLQLAMDIIIRIQPPARHAARRGAALGGDYHKGAGEKNLSDNPEISIVKFITTKNGNFPT
jgi:hypothetical protein